MIEREGPHDLARGGEAAARIQISLPYALREYTRGLESVELVARHLAEAIAQLNRRFPGLAYRILDDQGQLRRYVQAFVNDEPVSHLSLGEIRLRNGDVVTILPSVAGG